MQHLSGDPTLSPVVTYNALCIYLFIYFCFYFQSLAEQIELKETVSTLDTHI